MLSPQQRSPKTAFRLSPRPDTLVFIDPAVDDIQQLATDIYLKAEIIVLNLTEDGITQISQVLQQYNNLKTLHLVSHGSPGCLYLGSSQLSLTTLAQYESALRSWKKAFSAESPAILLYGCEVAATETGRVFIEKLQQLTEVDIAASAKLTGNSELGGDWELEVRTGEIETSLAFSKAVREAYAGILATYTVNTLVDENDGIEDGEISLREAIEAANSSAGEDTIEFDAELSGGTIILDNGQLSITDDLTIEGLGAENLTISGNNNSRVFKVDDEDSDNEIEVAIEGLTLTNGRTDFNGGGIYNRENLIVTNSYINDNAAYGRNQGGGLYNAGTLTVTNSTVLGNYANSGAGLFNTGTLTVTNSTVSDNSANTGNGGGIFNTGTLNVSDSDISRNSASDYGYGDEVSLIQGGGIYNSNSGNLTVTNSTISNNNVSNSSYRGSNFDSRGGGISNSGTIILTNSTVSGNQAVSSNQAERYTGNSSTNSQGGGINNSGTITIISSSISGNQAVSNSKAEEYTGDSSASSRGGGINNSGAITIISSSISGNQVVSNSKTEDYFGDSYADSRGGGISNSGTIILTNSTISDNQVSSSSDDDGSFTSSYASHQGGGINNSGTLTLTNSTISGNQVFSSSSSVFDEIRSNGGGINNAGTLALTNSTVTLNNATTGGGINSSGSGSTSQVSNSIIADNFNSDVSGTFSSLGYNLIGTGDGVTDFNQTGDITVVTDPGLDALADNGGPTLTHALLPNSPAVNFGNNALLPPDTADLDGDGNTSEPLPVDQRGEPRIQGDTVDIGAFESNFTGVPLPTVSLTLSSSIAREGEESVVYRLSRTGSLDSALTIQLSAAGSEGLTSDDFTLTGATGTFPNFTVTFAAGESQAEFMLSALEDLMVESEETLAISLAENGTYRVDQFDNSGTISIFNRALTVTNTNDSGNGSLRQAILNANTIAGANTIVFAESLSGQTITLTSGELSITDDLTIDGLGAENLTISGNNTSRIFINQDNLEIEGLTLTDGSSSDGGAISNRGVLTLRNSIITGNTASNRGGGIYGNGRLTVTNSMIASNTANLGGGISSRFGNVVLNDSTLSGNTANTSGGAIHTEGLLAVFYDYYYYEREAQVFDSGNLTVSNSTITNNTAGAGGGGIFNDNSDVEVIDSIISGNIAGTDGGGLISKSDFNNDEAGAYSTGSVTLSNSIISGNTAGSNGGGIWGDFRHQTNSYSDFNSGLILHNSTVSINQAGSDGGGIWSNFSFDSQFDISSSTISGNTADEDGGGIFTSGYLGGFFNYYPLIANSTISGNTASEDGGGIFNNAIGLVLINNTITANTANSEGSGIFNNSSNSFGDKSISVGNTIIAANTDNKDIAGNPFTSQGYNLIGNGDGASGFNNTGDQVGTSSNPIDPLLGPLQNNGGPTETHALLEGSPAIDASSNFIFETDQRGEPRNQGLRVDIGAYESFSAISLAVLTLRTLLNGIDEADTTPAIFTLSREGNTSGELVVNFSLGGTATLGDDYTLSNVNLNNNTLTFATGQSSLDITLTPINDNLFDPNETIQLNLLAGSGYVLGMPNSDGLTINDSFSNVTLSASGTPTEANMTPATFTLRRERNTSGELVVNFSLGGTARLGLDYTLSNVNLNDNTLTFAAGQSSLDITLTPINDSLFDPNETVEFNLISGSGYVLETPNSASLTILDNDGKVINGTSLSESLIGTDFNDTFNGKGGEDTLTGGLGNDRYTVNSLGDIVVELSNEGNDTVNASVTYTLSANVENLTLTGSTDIDGTGNELNNVIKGNTGKNLLQGLAGNDSLNGGGGNDTLIGGIGQDTLNGGTGNDRMSGGEGDDLYTVDSLGDVVTELANQGNDAVNASVTYNLSANVENLTLTGATNINGKGNSLGNVLKGNGGNNRLQGLGGNDLITGGAGNDTLVGGAGNDTLTGGSGTDQYLFSGKFSSLGVDTLTDFVQGSDKLVLSRTTFNALETTSGTLVEGELASIRVELAQEMAIAGVSSANLVYNSRSGNLFYNANGADEGFGEGGQLTSLTRKPSSLQVTDFLVQAV